MWNPWSSWKRQPSKRSERHIKTNGSPDLFFLGEIRCENKFENQAPVGFRLHGGRWLPDYMPDDTALAYVGKEGLSIITGCSHAGICNIIAQAKELPEKYGSIVFWVAFT